jgi:formate hydrogenlyase transcriptional activator
VLREREIERVGGNNSIPVDVRVVAATHWDLNVLVAEGRFRGDVLCRLKVVPIEAPPLRERAADISLLMEYFIDRFGKTAGKKFKAIAKEEGWLKRELRGNPKRSGTLHGSLLKQEKEND